MTDRQTDRQAGRQAGRQTSQYTNKIYKKDNYCVDFGTIISVSFSYLVSHSKELLLKEIGRTLSRTYFPITQFIQAPSSSTITPYYLLDIGVEWKNHTTGTVLVQCCQIFTRLST